MGLSFTASGSTQNHIAYTGKNYDLVARTGSSGSAPTSGINSGATLTANTTGRLTCT